MKLVFKSPFSDIFNVLKMSSFLLKAQLSPAVNTPANFLDQVCIKGPAEVAHHVLNVCQGPGLTPEDV